MQSFHFLARESLGLAVSKADIAEIAAARPITRAWRPAVGPAGWRLFILLNATLFLRPAEVVPSLEQLPIYQCVILMCAVAAWGPLLDRLRWKRVLREPITFCVLGLLAAVLLSNFSHLNFYGAREDGLEFAKVIIYYALLITIVDTPARLRQFMIWVLVFATALTCLALLQYHNVIHVPALAECYERQADEPDPESGQTTVLTRLCGAGIFGNPNDLSRLLAIGMAICLYCIADRRFGAMRWLWVGPFVLLGHALQLTYSRGGLLALLATLTALGWARFGWRKTAIVAGIALPVIAVVYAGRQMNITTESGTGQQRIQIWSEGFALLARSPVFGIGTNQYREEVGYVAHNSFLHCFTEMGLFGGILFAGAFYLALALPRGLMRESGADQVELVRLSGYVWAIVGGYVVGMLSSTRSYTLTTYIVLGLACAAVNLGTPQDLSVVNSRLLRRLTLVGLAVLAATYLYVRLSVHWA